LIKQPANPEYFSQDKKKFVVVRIRGASSEGKVVRVYRPPLLEEVEEQWAKLEGRWVDGFALCAPMVRGLES